MSAPEQAESFEGSGSRIKLTRNAKGDCQIEVSVREGTAGEELDRLRGLAVANYRTLEREFYGPPLGARAAVG